MYAPLCINGYETAYKESSGVKDKPAEQISDLLIANMINTKHVNEAVSNLRQLHLGTFDMTVHKPKSHEDLDGPEALGGDWTWGNGQATIGHFIGGYGARYYSYLSSQVYSTDMFYTAFKENPMNGKEGRRYRHAVLELGASQDEMKTLEDFLGSKLSTEAFCKELGIAKKKVEIYGGC